jgi:hypothetical protein
MSSAHDDDHEEDGAGGPKYEPPKKVDLKDLVNQDEGDESLRKVSTNGTEKTRRKEEK